LQNGDVTHLEFVDPASGSVWTYYPLQGGKVLPASGAITLAYPTTSCSGTEYVLFWQTPRYAMSVPNKSGYFVIPDGVLPTQVATLSMNSGSGCQQGSLSSYAVPSSVLAPVTAPAAPPGTPPYHPEIL
jgi:hypothetical protein